MSVLNAPHFQDEAAAYAFVETRVWPEGPVCPHCGAGKDKVGKLAGKSTRIGVHKCYACRKPFSVKVGTIFESSHVALHLWLQAIFLLCSSKKGISANQLHRTLGVTLKTAWFMAHRVREAMRSESPILLGGAGQVVEMDETYLNTKPNKAGEYQERAIAALVERGGPVRSFHVDRMNADAVEVILARNASERSTLSTDESRLYMQVGRYFAGHAKVNHSKGEYVRGDAHTNTIEGFFSIFKRGMKGIYQHCDGKHLHRYLAEFDFRYSHRLALGVDDAIRADYALRGIKGKRLTYRRAH